MIKIWNAPRWAILLGGNSEPDQTKNKINIIRKKSEYNLFTEKTNS